MDNQIFNQPHSAPFPKDSSNESNTLNYAGFLRRFLAFLIDGFFTGILSLLFGFFIGNDLIMNISLGAFINIIYFSVFDSSELMGTPGKALLSIVVVTENNPNRISFQSALIRYLCKYISSAVLLLGYLIQPFTNRRQTFHDLVANTIVIKKDPGQLSYWKAFKDNFRHILNN